jgi:hypothetical protein
MMVSYSIIIIDRSLVSVNFLLLKVYIYIYIYGSANERQLTVTKMIIVNGWLKNKQRNFGNASLCTYLVQICRI